MRGSRPQCQPRETGDAPASGRGIAGRQRQSTIAVTAMKPTVAISQAVRSFPPDAAHGADHGECRDGRGNDHVGRSVPERRRSCRWSLTTRRRRVPSIGWPSCQDRGRSKTWVEPANTLVGAPVVSDLLALSPSPECAERLHTELVIEAFPRSANTFATVAFQLSQPAPVRVAHHLHAPAQVTEARGADAGAAASSGILATPSFPRWSGRRGSR